MMIFRLFLLTKVIIYDNLLTCEKRIADKKNNERMSTESFTTNKKERMQEGVSLAQGEKKHLAGQQLTPRYEVVQQLKDARKAQDMTQEVLAERVGTKKSNISRFESGKYNPSLDFLIKVAGSLGKQVQIRIK